VRRDESNHNTTRGAIIDLNLVRSVTFLLRLLDKDGAAVSAAKTSTPITGSSSSSGRSGSGVAGFGVGFAGTDDDDGEDGARPLLPSQSSCRCTG